MLKAKTLLEDSKYLLIKQKEKKFLINQKETTIFSSSKIFAQQEKRKQPESLT